MLDLYRLNYTRNEGTHDCDSKLLPQKKITAMKNQAALNEVQAHHAEHPVSMIDTYFCRYTV